MRGGAADVSGTGSGATLSSQGVVTAWAPTSSDDTLGGPGSVNPLVTTDGKMALDTEWPESRGPGASIGVIESGGIAGRSVRRVDDLAKLGNSVREMTLRFSAASGADVELVRRMLVSTACGAAMTRARLPGVDAPSGPISALSKYRPVPTRLRITRSSSGQSAQMEIKMERVE